MEHFIETVRKYPCLWNTAAVEYRDQELKDAAWAEVMKETDLSSVKEVKQKWKKLRDSYRDALKRQSDMQAREAAPGGKRSYAWKYMAPMQFLQPHMSARKKPAESPAPARAANGDARSSDDSESDASSRSAGRLSAVERQLALLCRAAQRRAEPPARARKRPPPPDPLDIFFNGMCQSAKRFPYAAQIKIKRTLFEAVLEAEEALVAEQQTYASLWARGAGSSSSSDAEPDDDDRKPS